MTRHSTRTIRAFGTAMLTAILALTISQPVEAGQRRARLSRDLSERLAAGDASTTRVIVCGSDSKIDTLATRYGAQLKKRLRGCAVLEVTGGQLDALSQDADVDQLSGDAPVFRMSVTTEATGADQVWAGSEGIAGFTGRGIGVAVIDTGIATHRDSGSIVVSQDFIEALGRKGDDGNGHGTHVSGTINAGAKGGYPGVAPGAHIINLRALNADGSGFTSNVIEAIDWAIDNRDRYNIRVMNLSLGQPVYESYLTDPLCIAVQQATDAGILVVRGGRQLRQRRAGPADRRRRHLAGQLRRRR